MARAAVGVTWILLLAGCAGGRVLVGAEAESPERAVLSADPFTVIQLATLHSPNEAFVVDRGDALELAVSAGWYKVTYACDVPMCDGRTGDIVLREYNTERTIRAESGHRYKLACSCKKVGVLEIRDLGYGPN